MADRIIDLQYTLSCPQGFVPGRSRMAFCICGKTGSRMQVLGALHPALAARASIYVAPYIGKGRVTMVMPFKLWVLKE